MLLYLKKKCSSSLSMYYEIRTVGFELVVMGMQMNSFIEIFRNEGRFSYRQKYSGLVDWFNSEDCL